MERPIERLHLYKEPEWAGGSYEADFKLGPHGIATLLVEFDQEEEIQ